MISLPDILPLMKVTIFYTSGNARAYLATSEEAASAEDQFLKGQNFAFSSLDVDDLATLLREIVNLANVENMQVSLFDPERDKPKPHPPAAKPPLVLSNFLPGATPTRKGAKTNGR